MKPNGGGTRTLSNPIKHYGDLDMVMQRNQLEQTGPIQRFLA